MSVVAGTVAGAAGTEPARWSARGPVWLGMLCLLVLVGGFGAWGSLSRLTGAVVAQGRIEVAQNRQVVQHQDGGIVSEILVAEGDRVAAGDLLIRLDAEQLASELATVEGQLLEVLARRARFEAEEAGAATLAFAPLLADGANPMAPALMAGAQGLFEARQATAASEAEQLGRQREQIGNQIEGIRAQEAAIVTQLALLDQELESQRSLLERGLAQAARVLELEREQASLAGRQGELAAAVAQAEGRITEIEIEILRIGSARREEASTQLRDLQFNEIELTERRRALMLRLDRLDIRAPVSGIVYGMAVFAPRSVVRAAEPLLYLVPQDRPLVIATQVPPIHIDQIHLGQEVSLRFSAFDQRQTPELEAKVVRISADAFQDEATSASFYRVDLELLPDEAARLPAGMTLIPGMPVDAFIATGDRTPLQYLLKPLSDYFTKAFRET